MQWNDHSSIEGKHALLSPSGYHWLDYDDDGLYRKYISQYAAEMGTTIHEFSKKMIKYGMKLSKTDTHLVLFYLLDHSIPHKAIDMEFIFPNLASYINDAIRLRMDPEVLLYYSNICFGTADAISFRDNLLRIHDLKTGTTPASMKQLYVYASLFCLEYKKEPKDIGMELRIYQNNEIIIDEPDPNLIYSYMDKIVYSCDYLNEIRGVSK